MSRLLNSVEAHKVFIRANFAGLAGIAWQGWLARGRCALVLNQLEVEAADNNSASHKIAVPMNVFPQEVVLGMLKATGYEADIIGRISQHLSEYNPLKEIVVVIIWGEDELSSYRLTSPKPQFDPPQAYITLKASNN